MRATWETDLPLPFYMFENLCSKLILRLINNNCLLFKQIRELIFLVALKILQDSIPIPRFSQLAPNWRSFIPRLLPASAVVQLEALSNKHQFSELTLTQLNN